MSDVDGRKPFRVKAFDVPNDRVESRQRSARARAYMASAAGGCGITLEGFLFVPLCASGGRRVNVPERILVNPQCRRTG